MIEYAQVAQSVYVYRWIDIVDIRKEGQAALDQLKAQNQGQPYVAIIDLEKLKRIPTDIMAMTKLMREEIQEGLCGYVVCGASSLAASFAKSFSVFIPVQYTFADDEDKAIAQAHALLQSGKQTPHPADAPPQEAIYPASVTGQTVSTSAEEAAFRVQWMVPGRVIYAQLHHQLQGEEPRQIDTILCDMLDSAENMFLVMDLREITEMKNPSVSRLQSTVNHRQHDNLNWLIYLTGTQMMSFLSSTAAQMAHKNHRIFHTTAELSDFLHKNLPDVAWDSLAFTVPE